MKRLLLGLTIVCSAALLGGCPIYSTSGDSRTCTADGRCFDCPSGSSPSDGTCIPWQCSPGDCPGGYGCSPNGCVPAADASDCSSYGCPSGYLCKLSGGQAQCVPRSSDAGPTSDSGTTTDAARADASSDGASDARADALSVSDASVASDAPQRLDASSASDALVSAVDASTASEASAPPPPPSPCNATADCEGVGAKCIDGQCTPQGQLCSDATQCVVAAESCVDGVCEALCGASVPCAAGYACDFTRGVCNLNPDQCAGSGSSTCLGGSTCVEERCVAPCVTGDAGPACSTGQVCVNGGCIPDEAAGFTCKNDGKSGELATSCGTLDICLHHDCYTECNPDAGAGACADPAQVCKEVTVAAGTYLVCGAASGLGSDCDPAAGKACETGVCINGYCR
jgi:hypothetical protein